MSTYMCRKQGRVKKKYTRNRYKHIKIKHKRNLDINLYLGYKIDKAITINPGIGHQHPRSSSIEIKRDTDCLVLTKPIELQLG